MHGRPEPVEKIGTRRGLTLIEILVVIGVIIILVTIIIVALAAATTRAGAARTTALMTSMSQGMSQFEREFNQLPRVLGHYSSTQPHDYRNLMNPPAPDEFDELQSWYSLTSPAEYLLGYGPATEDGADGPGLRDPGADGVWNATADANGNNTPGELNDRRPATTGRVYGPYMQLEEAQLVGALVAFRNNDPQQPIVALPGESAYDPDAPKVILDYWGQPIRYYLQHPPRGGLNFPFGAQNRMNLGDVYLLRPFQIPQSEDAFGAPDRRGDDGTTYALKSAKFAFFSPGPDRTGNQNYRVDDPDAGANTSFNNEDNIVEVGR